MNRSFRPPLLALLPALLLAGALACAALLAAGCGNASSAEGAGQDTLDTHADSMAMQMYEASGGPEVWKGTPALSFTFAVGRAARGDTTRREVARHWWRRSDGRYRVEWSDGPDSAYVAVFNTNEFGAEPPTGHATLNGARLDSAARERTLRQAHIRFANDTYWLLAPLKLFNGGVHRTVEADPAKSDFAKGTPGKALHLTFGEVGITTEDRYWLTPDSSTGRLGRWTFHLQGMGPEQPPGVFRWAGYRTFSTPAGTLTLSTRKENVGGPSIIYTDEIRTPATLSDSLFTVSNE